MNKIKPAAVAGKFYPLEKDELVAQLNQFAKNNLKRYAYFSRAIIVPHAGYFYSGQLANNGFQCLNRNAKNVFVFAPSHYQKFNGLGLSSADEWATPLAKTGLNKSIVTDLLRSFIYCDYVDEAFEMEHSIEVQLPFIQEFLPQARIVPILIGDASVSEIVSVLEKFWDNDDNVFVFSSDLSHFYSAENANKIDFITAEMVESNNFEQFNCEQACGALGIRAVLDFAKKNDYSMIRVGLYNSGDITGEKSSVVGYGSWFMYQGDKSEFIKKYYSDLILEICKKSIKSGLSDEKPELDLKNIPPIFNQKGACFVTLEKSGMLRGCIGSIVAHRSLLQDLIENSYSAAFSDPRFMPVEEAELETISIAVSLLSEPEKMRFKDEIDLISQIIPDEDGIIIKDGVHQAVYLPSVWEQLPDVKMFLQSLKLKAGLSADHFSDTFEAYRFRVQYVK